LEVLELICPPVLSFGTWVVLLSLLAYGKNIFFYSNQIMFGLVFAHLDYFMSSRNFKGAFSQIGLMHSKFILEMSLIRFKSRTTSEGANIMQSHLTKLTTTYSVKTTIFMSWGWNLSIEYLNECFNKLI